MYCVQALLCSRSYIRPLYWKATYIIIDSTLCSHFESIVLVVVGSKAFMNLLLSDLYTDGWQITKFTF